MIFFLFSRQAHLLAVVALSSFARGVLLDQLGALLLLPVVFLRPVAPSLFLHFPHFHFLFSSLVFSSFRCFSIAFLLAVCLHRRDVLCLVIVSQIPLGSLSLFFRVFPCSPLVVLQALVVSASISGLPCLFLFPGIVFPGPS